LESQYTNLFSWRNSYHEISRSLDNPNVEHQETFIARHVNTYS